MSEIEYKKAENRFNKLYEKLYFTADGLTRAEQLEYMHLTDMLVKADQERAFDNLIRSGDYRTA